MSSKTNFWCLGTFRQWNCSSTCKVWFDKRSLGSSCPVLCFTILCKGHVIQVSSPEFKEKESWHAILPNKGQSLYINQRLVAFFIRSRSSAYSISRAWNIVWSHNCWFTQGRNPFFGSQHQPSCLQQSHVIFRAQWLQEQLCLLSLLLIQRSSRS